MKKKITSLVLALTLLTGTSAFAEKAPMTVKKSPARIPNSVYTEPYQENQFVTVYAPWMRNFHLICDDELNSGYYGGEGCQQVRGAAQSPVNADIMYFITNTSGVYVTKNGGKNWYNCTNNNGGWDNVGIICDAFDEATVYIHMRGTGVQRSRDYGRTWELIIDDNETSVTKGHRDNNLAIDGKGNLYMALSHGIYSLDRETEELTKLWPQGETALEAVPKWFDIEVSPDGQDIYATQTAANLARGLWVSHDGGKTWEQKLAETEEKVHIIRSIALHPENPKEIYITCDINDKVDTTKNVPSALYRTTDDFQTLEFLTYQGYENKEEGVSFSYKPFYGLKFGPKNPQGIYPMYYCGQTITYPIRVSYDYGKTFKNTMKPEHSEGVVTARYPEGKDIYKGWRYKAFIADWSNPVGRIVHFEGGPGEWLAETDTVNRLSSGFSGACVTNFATSATGRTFLCTTDVGGFIHQSGTYGENSYPTYEAYVKDAESYKFTFAIFDPNDDSHIIGWVGVNNGVHEYYGIRQSFDGGKTFDVPGDDRKIPAAEIHALRNTRLLQYDAWDDKTIYTTYFTSHDNGKTWEENEYLYLAVSKTTPGKIFGMKGSGKAAEFYLSEDGGETWKYLCTPGTGGGFYGVIFDADDRYVWYTEKRDLIKLDTQSGTTESNKSKFAAYPGFKYIVQNPKEPKHMLLTTYTGLLTGKFSDDPKVWETRDGGKTWHGVPGLMGQETHTPTFSNNTDEVFIGTMAGVFIYNYREYWNYLDTKITVEIDGTEADFSEMPVIENSRAMVPMRELFELLDAKVSYDAETGEISARKGNNYITMKAGSLSATLNGKDVTLDAAPYVTAKGRTMVPIRFAAEALDVNVGWDGEGRIVGIYS